MKEVLLHISKFALLVLWGKHSVTGRSALSAGAAVTGNPEHHL